MAERTATVQELDAALAEAQRSLPAYVKIGEPLPAPNTAGANWHASVLIVGSGVDVMPGVEAVEAVKRRLPIVDSEALQARIGQRQ